MQAAASALSACSAELRDLLLDLLLGADDVRVVLHEPAHAHDAVQRAARLVARAVAELGEAQRQVLVGAHAALEDLERAGAVHGLHREDALLALRDEHVRLVVVPVPAPLPEAARHDGGGVDLLVAVLDELRAHVVLQRHVDRPALRVPEDLAGVLGVEVEEVELHAEAAVVALLRLLEAGDVGVELRLVLADDAVDALEHLVVLVAAVVAARHLHELDGADLRGVLHVRAAAHLEVVAHLVRADRLALGDVREALELVLLAGEARRHVGTRHLGAHERLVKRDEARDFLFKGGEVLRGEPMLKVEVVVEAVVRCRTDVRLRAGKEVADRTRGQVRGGMPPHFICNFHLFVRFSPWNASMIPHFRCGNKQKRT